MNEADKVIIIVFGSISIIWLCCLATIKCKITKKISDRLEKIRKRFISVHVEDINIKTMFEETKYGDIESNLESNKESQCEESRPSQQV